MSEDSEKSAKRASEDGDEATDDITRAAIGRTQTEAPPKKRKPSKSDLSPPMEVDDVKPAPYKRRHVLFDEARRLASLPRNRRSELAQTAFWSGIVALPGGIAGSFDLFAKNSTQNKIFDLAEIIILIICITVFVVGLSSKEESDKTSIEYLYELYPQETNDKTVEKPNKILIYRMVEFLFW